MCRIPACRIAVAAVLALAGTAPDARAHLLVTEVGYDPVDETGATAEFVEILNPDPAPAPLGNVWLAGDEDAYPYLVNGPVESITLGNFIYRFPALALAPNHVVVVCHDSDAFLAEHFPGGGLAAFQAQPGNPILLEVTQDGAADGVADMIPWGSNPDGTLSMANNGECVGLVTWDGTSDLVQDVDWVCWLTTTYIPNKDVDYPFGFDGPDADFDPSFYAEDRADGIPAPDAPEGSSIHRTSLVEKGEVTSGGNGVTGHDETSEDWSTWKVGPFSPGVCALSSVGVGLPVPPPSSLSVRVASANPFVRDVRLAYSMPRAGHVRVTIHDLAGRIVARVVDADEPAGTHAATWDGRDRNGQAVPAGLYVARVASGGENGFARLYAVR